MLNYGSVCHREPFFDHSVGLNTFVVTLFRMCLYVFLMLCSFLFCGSDFTLICCNLHLTQVNLTSLSCCCLQRMDCHVDSYVFLVLKFSLTLNWCISSIPCRLLSAFLCCESGMSKWRLYFKFSFRFLFVYRILWVYDFHIWKTWLATSYIIILVDLFFIDLCLWSWNDRLVGIKILWEVLLDGPERLTLSLHSKWGFFSSDGILIELIVTLLFSIVTFVFFFNSNFLCILNKNNFGFKTSKNKECVGGSFTRQAKWT